MKTQRLSRRNFLAGAGFGLVSLTLTACAAPMAPNAAPAVGQQGAPAESAAQPVRILWISQAALVEYFENYSTQVFSPANDGASVEIEIAPNAEFPQKLLSSFAAGNAYDIFRAVNVADFAQLATSGVILALDDLIARDNYQTHLDTFLPGSLDAGRMQGKQFGIPFGAHPGSRYVFYNKTALGENGFQIDNLDWTWRDFAEISMAMNDPENDVFGCWIRSNYEGYLVGVRAMGGDLIDETGTKSLIGADEARRWFTYVYDMINVHGTMPQPTEVSDWKPPFAASKIMMANDSGYRESFLREMVEGFEFDSFVVPNEGDIPRSSLICDFSAIASGSQNVDLAWEWAKGLLEPEQGKLRVNVAQFIPLPIKEALLDSDATPSPQYEFYVQNWIDEPPLPVPLPANGRQTEIFQILQIGFEEAWLQVSPLEEVIDRVHDEIQTILDKPPV